MNPNVIVLAIMVIFASFVAYSQTPPSTNDVQYTVQDLSVLVPPGYLHSIADDINNNGDVVGQSWNPGQTSQPWIYTASNGVIRAINCGNFGPILSQLRINNNTNDTQIITTIYSNGPFGSSGMPSTILKWHQANIDQLPTVVASGPGAWASGISDSGMVVGQIWQNYSVTRTGNIYSGGVVVGQHLSPIPHSESQPACWFDGGNGVKLLYYPNLNQVPPCVTTLGEVHHGRLSGNSCVTSDNGLIAGGQFRDFAHDWVGGFPDPAFPGMYSFFTSNNGDHLVEQANGNGIGVDGLPEYCPTPVAVNNSGQVLEWHYVPNTPNLSPYGIWTSGTPRVSLPQGSGIGYPQHMNNAGVLAGGGTVWTPDANGAYSVHFITDNIEPINFSIWDTQGINDAGQMVGYGYDTNGVAHAWLVTPTTGGIQVDANRDGEVTFDGQDKTTSEQPFRFWCNDDTDEIVDGVEQDINPRGHPPDFRHTEIANQRDLEDFARIHIKAPPKFDASDKHWKVVVLFTEVVEESPQRSPQINLWKALTPKTSYLFNDNVAGNLVGQSKLRSVNASREWTIPSDLFSNSEKKAWLLFDARTPGRGALTVRFYKSNQKIAESKVYLDLKPLHELYEHFTVGDTDNRNIDPDTIPAIARPTPDSGTYTSQSPEEPNYILFVHGWRMQPWERRAFAETAYKRLWHQGYKGRFGLFSWPTEWHSGSYWSHATNRLNYDRSERKAWNSAQGLRGLLIGLNQQYTGKVRVFAHSMGNIVVSEALRQEAVSSAQMLLHTYVATQAASVTHSYDQSAPTILPDAETPNLYANYPLNAGMEYFGGIEASAGKFVNFFNPDDYALHTAPGGGWELNQRTKPDSGYLYRNNQFIRKPGIILNIPINIFEIFSHVDQARSRALGAQADVRGAFEDELDLNATFAFGNAEFEHSAQFNYNNMMRAPYWNRLLDAFELLLPPPLP